MAGPVFSQSQSRFVLPGAIDYGVGVTTINDSTYQFRVALLTDQTGSGFSASQIQVGWRVFTNTKRMYRITVSENGGFTGRILTAVEVPSTNGPPNGTQLVVYQYDGTNLAIPTAPVNSSGISGSFDGILVNHNFVVLNSTGGGGAGDPQIPEKTYEVTVSGTGTTIDLPFTPNALYPVVVYRNGPLCDDCELNGAKDEISLTYGYTAGEKFFITYY